MLARGNALMTTSTVACWTTLERRFDQHVRQVEYFRQAGPDAVARMCQTQSPLTAFAPCNGFAPARLRHSQGLHLVPRFGVAGNLTRRGESEKENTDESQYADYSSYRLYWVWFRDYGSDLDPLNTKRATDDQSVNAQDDATS